MSKKPLVSLIAALLMVLGSTSNAHAWFKFKNSTAETVWVAFGWYKPSCEEYGSPWAKAGWWKLAPGETKTVFGEDLQDVNKYYYYYAQGSNGAVWTGPFHTYVAYNSFNMCWSLAETVSHGPAPGFNAGFREKYIGNYNNYTVNLVY